MVLFFNLSPGMGPMSRRVPEIFIVGTMKGGTTILYDYLCTHPRVLPGRQKEYHYFSLYATRGIDWYIEQFPDRADEQLSIDASPTYFDVARMPTIPAYIQKAAPMARIILIVRDPVDRAISHVQHLRSVSHKELFTNVDINEFLNRPLRNCYTLPHATDTHLAHVLEFSLYDDKFANYVRIFGRENVLVLRNEDLAIDPAEAMKKTFSHCGLERVPSEIFGTRRYQSGSQGLPIEKRVRDRLRGLLVSGLRSVSAARGSARNRFKKCFNLRAGAVVSGYRPRLRWREASEAPCRYSQQAPEIPLRPRSIGRG